MAINSLSASSKGFAGLASGIDTENVVKQMLSGTQSKIDTQNQKKTQLEYKQEMYRTVISDLQKFQQSYFSYSNQATNLLSQSFFQTKSATTSSKSYVVTATSSAAAGDIKVGKIKSLASSFKQTAKTPASAGISGVINSDKLDKLKETLDEKITFKIGTESFDIALKELAGKNSLEVRNVLNSKLQEKLPDKASVDYINGSFTLKTADAQAEFSITGSEKALRLIGGARVTGTGGASFKVNATVVLPTLAVTIDGTSKSITFDPLNTSVSIGEQLNTAIALAFGSGIEVSDAGNILTIKENPLNEDGTAKKDLTRKITLSGDEDTMAALGLKKTVSNKLALNTSLSSNFFATPVVGQLQEFTINDVDFSFSSDQSISSIMNAINDSAAGVKVSYSATTDKFTLEATASGKRGSFFEVSQTEGNLMTAMFGVGATGRTTGATLTRQMTSASLPAGDFLFEGGTVNLNVNGKKVSMGLPSAYNSPDDLVEVMNTALTMQFGKDKGGNSNVSFSISSDGKTVNLNAAEGYTAYIDDDSLAALGFKAKVTGGTTLADLGITEPIKFHFEDAPTEEAKNVEIGTDMTLDNMIAKVKDAYAAAGGTPANLDISFKESKAYIRICGVDIPMTFVDSSGKLFGQTEGNLSASPAVTTENLFDKTSEGSNAIAEINGVTVERNTNSFSVDGVNLTLLSQTDEESTITVTRDTDAIYDTVIKFMTDYNTLTNSINTLLDADPTYKSYLPLTATQEDEMSEKQIEKWEQKSREGLLRNDGALNSVLASLRKTLYTKPEGSPALYDLGISTSYFGTKDNLTVSDPAKLKTLIAEDPEAIMRLFTDTDTGLATLLNKALSDAARTSPIDPGSLVRIAGTSGKSDTSSSIYKQIKDIKSGLDRLETRYENEYSRYWKQFNSMESMISNMNSTSSWLSSMMSSM